jgi:hypothetical protein
MKDNLRISWDMANFQSEKKGERRSKMVDTWWTLGHWPAWFQTDCPDFHGSKDQLTLLFLPAKILSIHRGHIIFIDLPLN